jgi:hypothetical protein
MGVDRVMNMKKRLLFVLWSFFCCLLIATFITLWSPLNLRVARAVQTIYGGVYGWKYVTPQEALWLEVTPIGIGPTSNANFVVTYKMKCIDGRTSVVNASPSTGNQNPTPGFTPGSGMLIDQFSFQISAGAGSNFNGFGKNFPCEGWLMSAAMSHDGTTLVRGVVYLQLQIMTALPGVATNVLTSTSATGQPTQFNGYIESLLVCGNVPSAYAYSWPEDNCADPAPGYQLNFDIPGGWSEPGSSLPAPGAAANWTYSPNAAIRNRIINITQTVATSATAGARYVGIVLVSGGVIVAGPFDSYPQQASQTVTYNYSSGTGSSGTCSSLGSAQASVLCDTVQIGLPTYLEFVSALDGVTVQSCVRSGNVANTVANCTSGFQTGDQISNIHVRVQLTHETS